MKRATRSRAERLWEKVDRTGGPDACWPFMGSRTKGYGRIYDDALGRMVPAHRAAYEEHFGVTLPREILVLHSCDYRPCSNPSHLFEGDDKLNSDDKISKGRDVHPRHASDKWHRTKLTAEQVGEIRSLIGRQSLRSIARDYGVTYKAVWCIKEGRSWSPDKPENKHLKGII